MPDPGHAFIPRIKGFLEKLLQEQGFEVTGTSQLSREIEELKTLKSDIHKNWPWSTQALPPVDRKMVAESRAAFRRQEGESIDDLIRRFGGDPAKGV